MNDKASQTTPSAKASGRGGDAATPVDMEELKRDMRNAQLLDWAKRNQASLIVAVALVALAFVGTATWINKARSERNAAASIYYQALTLNKGSDKVKMLNVLIDRHFGTVYTALAQMQLAHLDPTHAQAHLQALIANGDSMPQWVWQARMDLAKLLLAEGKASKAMPLLQHSVGAAYEQLRQSLLADASTDPADKIRHLKLAQAAESHDDALKRRIDNELQQLEAANNATPSGS